MSPSKGNIVPDSDLIDQLANEVWGGEPDSAAVDVSNTPEFPQQDAVYRSEDDRNLTDGTEQMAMSSVKLAQDDLPNPLKPEATPDFNDVSHNSFEQDVAVKHWVDTAVDMLNRGQTPEEVLAQLAHDGCPDPQNVLVQAQRQPTIEENVGEQTDRPAGGIPPATVYEEQGSAVQPLGVQSSRVSVGGKVGVVTDSYETIYGPTKVVSFDDGTWEEIPEDFIQPVAEDRTASQHIRDFIASLPKPDEHDFNAVAEARRSIAKAQDLCHLAVANGHIDIVPIQVQMDRESERLASLLHDMAEEYNESFHKASPEIEIVGEVRSSAAIDEAYEAILHEASMLDIRKEIDEIMPIMMHESSLEDVQEGFATERCMRYLAGRFSSVEDDDYRNFLLGEARQKANQIASARTPQTPKTASAEIDFDGPVEDLFL